MHDADLAALTLGLLVPGDGEDARKTGELVAAQGVVDELADDDGGILARVAAALQRSAPEGGCLFDGEPHAVGAIGVQGLVGAIGVVWLK